MTTLTNAGKLRASYYLGYLNPVLERIDPGIIGKEYLAEKNKYYCSIKVEDSTEVDTFAPNPYIKVPPRYYTEEVAGLLRMLASHQPITVLRKDNQHHLFRSSVVKNRIIGSPNAVILKLNRTRNWGSIKSFSQVDTPFRTKKDQLVWRGSTTGRWGPQFATDIRNSHRYRLMLAAMRKCFNGGRLDFFKLCDVGVTDNVQEVDSFLPHDERDYLNKQFKRPKLTPEELLQYKFVLCLQGNDISTSLKWALSSNVVPIMPLPLYESWLMEGLLRPWVHFAPVKDDFSDLLQIVNFLARSPDLCEYMAGQGKIFMDQFSNADLELSIELVVLSRYIEYLKSI